MSLFVFQQLEQQRQQLLAERQQFFMEQTQLSEATAKNADKSIGQPQAPSAILTNVSSAASSGSDSTSLQVTQKPVSDSGNLKSTSEKDETADSAQAPAVDSTKLPSIPPGFSSTDKVSGMLVFLLL